MAIALVKLGSIASVSAATITPAFGQATTAGNFLLARVGGVVSAGGATPTTSATGWLQAQGINNDLSPTAIWYKPNCGTGETAPTFTVFNGTSMVADLSEWSGVATTSPLDQILLAGALAAPDATASDLAVTVYSQRNSKSATYTVTDNWGPSGGTVTAAQGTGATKQSFVVWFSAYLLNGHGGGVDDSNIPTVTPSTGATVTPDQSMASFLPAVASAPYPMRKNFVPQIRASHW